MYRVIDKTDTGKTRKLLEECAKNKGVFVCKHPERIVQKCVAYGIDPSDIALAVNYEDFLTDMLISYDKKIYIDELDNLLHELNCGIKGYSLTIDDEPQIDVLNKAKERLGEWLNGTYQS